MDSQRGTVDRVVDQRTEPPGRATETGEDRTSGLAMSTLFGTLVDGKESTMSQPDASGEAPAASLVGSLSVFTLSDVLSMLASTEQTGELQVVSETVDGRVWLDRGELSSAQVGTTITIGQAVFELACVIEGWFYFTTGPVSSSGQPTVPVAAVLTEVRPQVDEWREIREEIPLEAVVNLSPSPPGQDVQIRSDQWRVLTTVGNSGHSVASVLDTIGGDPIVGLRTLRDLYTAGLIELVPAPPVDSVSDDAPPSYGEASDNGSAITSLSSPPPIAVSADSATDDLSTVPPPPGLEPVVGSSDDRFDSLAEVAIMPPPIAGDPWTPSAESNGTDDNGVA
jgi:hypothetical protein